MVSVRIAARVQPVLPEAANGVPFRPVEFDKMTATAYIEESGDFNRIAWSMRAGGVREPGQRSKPAAGQTGPGSDKAVA